MKNLLLTYFCLAHCSLTLGRSIPITEFGARGDGKTLKTEAIQAAIDQCHTMGGGRPTNLAGVYTKNPQGLVARVHAPGRCGPESRCLRPPCQGIDSTQDKHPTGFRPDARPAIVCDDITNLEINAAQLQGQSQASTMIRLHNVGDAFIHASRVVGPCRAFVETEGEHSHAIHVAQNNHHAAN